MPQLKIAICGGGIASVCLAYSLCKSPRIEVKIFEGSNVLREDGAAVGLGSNAQQALELISPDLRKALDQAGGVRMDPSVRVMMGTGPESGKHIGDVRPAVAQIVVHRGPFLRAIRDLIPDHIFETGKRVVKFESTTDKVHLTFHDKTSYICDGLIGCDGINSITRKEVLGHDHPAASPVYTGGYNHRVIIPMETAIATFGEDYCKVRTQHGWVGDGGFQLTDWSDDGASMQVIAGRVTKEPWPHPTPFLEWPKEQLRKDLENWGEVGKAMTKIFTDQPKLYAAGGRIHPETPTYAKGQICIVGDAAQAFSPFQGAGAGQAIEDALILSIVLSGCHNSADIMKAFIVYDSIRRPRRSDVARSSGWAALLLTGRAPGIGLDMERIAEALTTFGDNIYEYGLEAACCDARERMAS